MRVKDPWARAKLYYELIFFHPFECIYTYVAVQSLQLQPSFCEINQNKICIWAGPDKCLVPAQLGKTNQNSRFSDYRMIVSENKRCIRKIMLQSMKTKHNGPKITKLWVLLYF